MNNKIINAKEYCQQIDDILTKRSKRRSLLRFALCSIIAIATVLVVFRYFLGIAVVSGDSMRPILREGDIVLYSRIVMLNRNDIIIAENDGIDVIKRVVAIEGDIISVDDRGHITLNGEKIKEPEILFGECSTEDIVKFPQTIKSGHVFFMGDNRPASLDSRNNKYGQIPMDQIRGEILFNFRLYDLEEENN